MIIRCPYCFARLGVLPTDPPARLIHHADGSHTVVPGDIPS